MLGDSQGQGLAEYSLLLGAIAVAVVAALFLLGEAASEPIVSTGEYVAGLRP